MRARRKNEGRREPQLWTVVNPELILPPSEIAGRFGGEDVSHSGWNLYARLRTPAHLLFKLTTAFPAFTPILARAIQPYPTKDFKKPASKLPPSPQFSLRSPFQVDFQMQPR
jgi:hypothetical protein